MPRTSYLRTTNWIDPHAPSMTVVVDAADLKSEDAYEAVEAHLDAGFFVTYEIFEGERSDQGFFEATLRAAEQSVEQDKRERNMAVAYFYYADALRLVQPDGSLFSTLPAPLSREDMAWVMRSLSKHENYKGQTVAVPLEDGTVITMKKGEVLPA